MKLDGYNVVENILRESDDDKKPGTLGTVAKVAGAGATIGGGLGLLGKHGGGNALVGAGKNIAAAGKAAANAPGAAKGAGAFRKSLGVGVRKLGGQAARGGFWKGARTGAGLGIGAGLIAAGANKLRSNKKQESVVEEGILKGNFLIKKVQHSCKNQVETGHLENRQGRINYYICLIKGYKSLLSSPDVSGFDKKTLGTLIAHYTASIKKLQSGGIPLV